MAFKRFPFGPEWMAPFRFAHAECAVRIDEPRCGAGVKRVGQLLRMNLRGR
ncbi:MAG: hypothetical protein OJF48_001244 [Afipia sp.]|nr:MAG: hypothetical protein OJF48_001244 [Afipia sp.]